MELEELKDPLRIGLLILLPGSRNRTSPPPFSPGPPPSWKKTEGHFVCFNSYLIPRKSLKCDYVSPHSEEHLFGQPIKQLVNFQNEKKKAKYLMSAG